ncbi:N-formylglutamate amidohydrolase [Methylocella silvestris BL2]|uniref:N-formylglutamate amidohydrolase n=1 Tax=Methylocella silvestris (strain DSM 15510 / CIP 108128 / LMG 27833 / NCIMB 13906 / BL2) TaxID=395965 RepID=B8EJ92_METSB|nr:N-formylglutamate amidohydrolase [Methylocella silvestris]ACK52584.1 N-formylglutamate amidohydrolase [Methylocella silvestris BL2]
MTLTKRASAQEAAAFEPVERIEGARDGGVLFICDHASNALPPPYGTLGLPQSELERHIGYDIGARALTLRLASLFGAPAVLSRFSRLLIDPNRGSDDPTLVMQLSDGAIVPGNAAIAAEEIERRIALYWRPYRDAVSVAVDMMTAAGPLPVVLSIHSFTPCWRGVTRPWEIGILWDSDARLAAPLIAALDEAGFCVGDNEPYDGALVGDTLDEEVTRRGLAGLLVEVRQDLISTKEQAERYADRLAPIFASVLALPELRQLAFLPSRTGRHAER